MDPHLNLFYSYQKGDQNSFDGRKCLEDNLTRAFLVTLKNLSEYQQQVFLQDLFGNGFTANSKKNGIRYAIQNITDKAELNVAQKAIQKKILLIGGKKINTGLFYEKCSSLDTLIKTFKGLDNKQQTEKMEELRHHLVKHQQKGDDSANIDFMGQKINGNEVSGVYELLHGCRPDGWIFNNHFAVLIESKIGNARQDERQIYRHLKDGKSGFGLNDAEIKNSFDHLYVFRTWEDIGLLLTHVAHNDPFVKDFNKFLVLIGEVMSLEFISDKNIGYSDAAMRVQFPKFLQKLFESVKIIDDNFHLANRPKESLWDYFGYKKNGVILTDPHYSVGFRDEDTDISLTTKKTTQMKKLLKSDALKKYLYAAASSDDPFKKQRVYLYLSSSRLLDWKSGQIRGAKQETFSFMFLLSEIAPNSTPEKPEVAIDKILKNMLDSVCFAKQLDFGVRVMYPTLTKKIKENGLLQSNKLLFENEQCLIKLYSNFVNETKDLFSLMRGG